MANDKIGFLEHLYQGELSSEQMVPDLATGDFERVDVLSERLRETMKDFDINKIEELGRIPDDLMERLKGLGIFGMIIPTEYGGLGFSIAEYLHFTETMAGMDMALVLVPLAHLSIGVMGLLLYGTEEQKRRYLPKAASGETIYSFALTEPSIGSDARSVRTRAQRTEDGNAYILDGTKTYITNANYAGAYMVFAQMDPEKEGSLGAFLVEREWEGVKIGKDMPKMGLHVSSTAAVMLKQVRVPAENLVGPAGEGFKIAMTILNYGRLALGASSAGLMSKSVDEMISRASSRKQFGVPIIDFELIQEKIARSKAHAYAARAMTYFTASLLDRNPLANVAIESSHTKLYGTTRGWDTLYDAMQTAGGSGYLSTMPYEKRMRDFRVTTIFEGTSEIHEVYPALGLFRSYGKVLERLGGIGKWFALQRVVASRPLSAMKETHPTLNRAAAAARKNERLLRVYLRTGFLRYGSKITGEELYLRRMTRLSLSLFWIVSAIGYLKARYPNEDYPQSELYLIEYLAAETEQIYRDYGSPKRSGTERAQAKVAASFLADAS